jgi:hypothetical protein
MGTNDYQWREKNTAMSGETEEHQVIRHGPGGTQGNFEHRGVAA